MMVLVVVVCWFDEVDYDTVYDTDHMWDNPSGYVVLFPSLYVLVVHMIDMHHEYDHHPYLHDDNQCSFG
jgi:hypothetical protein